MTTQIVEYTNEMGDFYIDQVTGETFMTINSTAKITGEYPKTISRIVNSFNGQNTYDTFGQKNVEVLTVKGKKPVTLLTEIEFVTIITKLCWKSDLCQQLLISLASVGTRVMLQQQAGFAPQSTVTGKPTALLTDGEYLALVDYASFTGQRVSRGFLKVLGGHLSRVAKHTGLNLKTIPDEKYGKKNLYPVELIKEHWDSRLQAYNARWSQ